MRAPVVAVAPGALLLLLLAAPSSTPAQQVDFTGSWVLNEKESDNPRGQFQGAGGRQPGMNPGSGGRPSGGRPSGGGRGGVMNEEDMERMRAMMRNVLQASGALRIVQDDSTITVVDLEGRLRVHHPDGRKKSYPVQGVGNVESRAKWDDGKLVVELRLDDGIRVSRTYELDEESRQLHVRMRMEGGQLQRAMDFRRVYDFVEEGSEG